MKLEQLNLTNFWSYKQAVLDFNYPTPTVVLGIKDDFSSNGAGKSSLFEAILWGLFGKTSKNIYADNVVNSTINKDCLVSISGSHGTESFLIKRYRKHTVYGNSLKFFINNSAITATTNSETQKYIEQYLQINFETFVHTCFFNPSNTKTFCALSSTQQKSIFEGILNLQKWTDLYDVATNEVKIINEGIFKAKIELDLLKKTRKNIVDKELAPLLKLKTSNTPTSSYNKKDLIDLKEAINFKTESVTNLSTSFEKMKVSLKAEFQDIKALEQKIASSKNKTCYACKQVLLSNILFDQLSKEYDEKKRAYQIKLPVTQDLEREVTSSKLELHTLELKRKVFEQQEQEEKARILQTKTLQKDVSNLRDKLKANLLEIEEMTTLMLLLGDKLVRYKGAQNALSNKGIKTYLINNILPSLTISCNKFLQHFNSGEFTIKFIVDTSARVALEVNNASGGDYAQLSAGESRRVDIALLLGLLEITAAFKSTPNFLVLDEVFDNLDEVGIDRTIEMLYSLERENIFVVTHNQSLAGKFQNQLRIKKSNGISTMEDI